MKCSPLQKIGGGAVFEPLERRRFLSVVSPMGDAIESGPAPYVQDVHIRGSAWSEGFMSYLDAARLGTFPLGRHVPTHYSAVMPWVNVNQITVRMTYDMAVEPDDLRIRGVAASTYAISSVESSVNALGSVTSATFTVVGVGFFQPDNLLIEVDGDPGGVHVRGGTTLLDGDRDGTPGGDFVFRMSVVPGDATRGGNVTQTDLGIVRRGIGTTAQFQGVVASYYDSLADFNGDGRINVTDLVHIRRRLFTYAPTGTPAPAAPAGVTAALRTRPAARGLFSFTPVLDG